ncbi:ribosomal maturation YjgA family protein [Methylobacterium sp. Leaf112]|uniref:ribosomal maturation YjgA family protein n=2 Tax=Methylobacterium TaxID=407 RepID=UPI0007001154|nr:DUF2809 domain-containing protein [Methylobacterium sp. Leaf112]KQP59550.1 hypothetical protein ASF52_11595 [Methylobacterium sp. Leaf112]
MTTRTMNRDRPAPLQERPTLLAATVAVVAMGTVLRLVPLGLPPALVKYGGSILWGAMVYGLVATVLPRPRRRIVVLAALVALAVELVRLVHAPGLDAFRATLAGQLLLGRIFSLWNLTAYAAGIAGAVLVDSRLRRTPTRGAPSDPQRR